MLHTKHRNHGNSADAGGSGRYRVGWIAWVICALLLAPRADAAVHYVYSSSVPGSPALSETVSSCSPGKRGYTTDLSQYGAVEVRRLIADQNGNVYLAGRNNSAGGAWVAKLDASGCLLFTATFPGGVANAVAADQRGEIYLAGSGPGRDFPVLFPIAAHPVPAGAPDGFLLRLSVDGGRLLSSTYVGGSVSAMALDADANIYLTGATYSSDFPDSLGVSPVKPSFSLAGVGAAFVMKLPRRADRVLFSGYVAGSERGCQSGSSCFLSYRNASGVAIGVDRERNILFAGNTDTTNLPATGGALLGRGIGAFVGKISPEGRLVYLTYLGARNDVSGNPAMPANLAFALAVDGGGNAVVTGRTRDENFPATPGVFQEEYSGPVVPPPAFLQQFDAFAVKLGPSGSVVWGTYMGGPERSETAAAVWLGANGEVWLAGTSVAHPAGFGVPNHFLARLNESASTRDYWAHFVEGSLEHVAMDAEGYLHAASASGVVTAFRPEGFPAARIAGIANAAGGPVGMEVAPGELVSIYGSDIGPEAESSADPRPGELAPEELGGVRVQFGGLPARLLYVSRSQINAIVPNALSPGSTVEARVGEAALTVRVMAAAPQVFRNAEGMAAAVNEDGTLNSASNPAPPGSIVAIWVTGTGADARPDGAVATTARDSGCCSARLNGAPVEVVYAGDAPGIVTAVTQVNVRLPETLTDIAPGITVSSGGAESDPAPVWVRTSGP